MSACDEGSGAHFWKISEIKRQISTHTHTAFDTLELFHFSTFAESDCFAMFATQSCRKRKKEREREREREIEREQMKQSQPGAGVCRNFADVTFLLFLLPLSSVLQSPFNVQFSFIETKRDFPISRRV